MNTTNKSGSNRKEKIWQKGGSSASSAAFKAWVFQAAKVSQLFHFDYNDMISRNGGRPMFKPLTLMLKTLGFHLRASMIRVIYVFLKRIFAIVRSQGIKGAAI